MKLIIKNSRKFKLDGFIYNFILPEMYDYVVTNFDKHVYNMYDPQIKDCVSEVLYTRNYLHTYKTQDMSYIIELDTTNIVSKSSAKLCDICNLMNYGNLQYPSTYIFTKIFNLVKERFWVLYQQYTGVPLINVNRII